MHDREFPLPEYRHMPGRNARPSDGLLESIATQVTPLVMNGNATDNKPWCYAVRLINEGYYWEAHEVLEALWNHALPNSRERSLIQCMIQLSNARLKALLGQPKAAVKLKKLTMDCYKRAFGLHTALLMGIRSDKLAMAIDQCDRVAQMQQLHVVGSQEDC